MGPTDKENTPSEFEIMPLKFKETLIQKIA
jgi:hypothetical protein